MSLSGIDVSLLGSYVVQVPLSEFEFSWSKISDIQSQVRNVLLGLVVLSRCD